MEEKESPVQRRTVNEGSRGFESEPPSLSHRPLLYSHTQQHHQPASHSSSYSTTDRTVSEACFDQQRGGVVVSQDLPTHSTFKCPGEECPRGTGSTNLTVLPECVFDVQRTERSRSYTWIRNQSSLSLATGSLFTLFHSVLWMTWFHSPRSLTPSTPFLPLLSSTHSLTQSVIPSQTYPSPFRTFYIRWFKRGSVPTELTKTASDGVNVHPTSHQRHRIRSLLPARP